MRKRKILLTGATGLLGRYLLRELLLAGHEVAVLVRDGAERAAERIDRLLEFWGQADGVTFARPAVLPGDVSLPSLGLGAADRAWLGRSCAAVLHAAANVGFRATPDGEPFKTNFDGTRHVAQLADEAGIEQFHHVSTAFICGQRGGTILEDELEEGQGFHNDYERSKFEAERLLRRGRARLTVYRPSVLVGDSRTGYTSAYHGVYRFLNLGNRLAQREGRSPRRSLPLRLPFTGSEPRNLVSVDWVARAISQIVEQPHSHGRTYHLTAVRPTPVAWITEQAEASLGLDGLSWAGPAGPPDPTPLEELFLAQISDYCPYLAGDPAFDRTRTNSALPDLPPPIVDRANLARLIRFAVADRWGRGRSRVLSAQPIDCGGYVEDFFPEAMRRSSLADVPLDVVVAFDVHGPGGGRWILRWVSGELVSVERVQTPPNAEVVFRLNTDVFAAIVSGRLPVHEAYQSRRVEIEGYVEKGLKLAALFAAFVAECPYEPGAREGENAPAVVGG
jgi:thioester reductase-like protein